MTILNTVKVGSTTGGGGGGGGGGNVTIVSGAGGAVVIDTTPTGSELALVTRPILPNPIEVAGGICIIGGCSDTSASVLNSAPTGIEYGLVTRPIISGTVNVNVVGSVAGVVTNTYGTVTLVNPNVPTTLVTYTVPSGTFIITGFVAGGDINAKFTMTINGNPVLTSRSTVAQQTVEVSFLGANPSVLSGQTILVQVLHQELGYQGNFEGTILGTIM